MSLQESNLESKLSQIHKDALSSDTCSLLDLDLKIMTRNLDTDEYINGKSECFVNKARSLLDEAKVRYVIVTFWKGNAYMCGLVEKSTNYMLDPNQEPGVLRRPSDLNYKWHISSGYDINDPWEELGSSVQAN